MKQKQKSIFLIATLICGIAQADETTVSSGKRSVNFLSATVATNTDLTDWRQIEVPKRRIHCSSAAQKLLAETLKHQGSRLDRECTKVEVTAELVVAISKSESQVVEAQVQASVNCVMRPVGEQFVISLIDRCEKILQNTGELSNDWEAIGCTDVLARSSQIERTSYDDISTIRCTVREQN